MLINAKENAKIANSAKDAKAEARFAKYAAIADKAIPRVRQQLEYEINSRAEKGERYYRETLGIHRGTGCNYGLLVGAIKAFDHNEETNMSTWSEGIRHVFPESRIHEYIWNLWDAMCMELVADLEEAGYEIKVERKYAGYTPFGKTERADTSSESLGDHYIQIRW